MSNVEPGTESTGQILFKRLLAIGTVTGVTVFALFLGEMLTSAVNPQDTSILNSDPTVGLVAAIAASFVGMAIGGLVYLVATGRGIEYVDVAKPTRQTLKYIGIGTVLSLGLLVVFNIFVAFAGLEVPEGWVTGVIGDNVEVGLLFLGVVFLFNAPAEEFLFRGVVQGRLSETFSVWSAIIITSLLFAVLHLPAYVMSGAGAAAIAPTVIVFGGAVIYGGLYAYTENLVVPIVAHGIFNAVQLTLYIVSITA